ncbi:probable palmitoyltransferase ZDHHC11B [Danaus plexippus]|uniref:probable palmitoyltransferase ZDHHC11B n=1 Tax=Danaus plexippus TaxID=13037 RepID=UPI002AAF451E|nr:probable palmitoyltransferase ZDHHC11B [Danaus plexippus]
MNKCLSTISTQRGQRRLNGIQLPLNYLQVIGWIVFVATIFLNFLVLVQIQFEVLKIIMYVLYCILYILHMVAHGFALFLDPSEYELRKMEVNTVPEFDRTIHAHVIENGRCHLCNINTSNKNTKHCGICNKCVYYFDHHCKWLNNCVGRRNYLAFILSVVSALLIALLTSALCLTDIVFFIKYPYNLSHEAQNFTNCLNAPEPIKYCSSSIALLTFLVTYCVSGLAIACALLHLLCFHVYIAMLGVSTYEYIMRNSQTKSLKFNFCRTNLQSNYLIGKNKVNSGQLTTRTNCDTEMIKPSTKSFISSIISDEINRARKALLHNNNTKIHPKLNDDVS